MVGGWYSWLVQRWQWSFGFNFVGSCSLHWIKYFHKDMGALRAREVKKVRGRTGSVTFGHWRTIQCQSSLLISIWVGFGCLDMLEVLRDIILLWWRWYCGMELAKYHGRLFQLSSESIQCNDGANSIASKSCSSVCWVGAWNYGRSLARMSGGFCCSDITCGNSSWQMVFFWQTMVKSE